jgi:hypothetical protein
MMDSIDLTNPQVRARVEELGAHAELNIMREFVARHPELLNVDQQTDLRNKRAVDEIMNQHGLALNAENLEWSLRAALEAGKVELAMYSPAEQEAFPRMSTQQMREYLQVRYQTPRPPNAAELLPTSGERMWRADTQTMNEEALATLRAKLMGTK